jgi:signal-transduction protein with cAMP-binding, CBS, and nucleotidyltransferase domain
MLLTFRPSVTVEGLARGTTQGWPCDGRLMADGCCIYQPWSHLLRSWGRRPGEPRLAGLTSLLPVRSMSGCGTYLNELSNNTSYERRYKLRTSETFVLVRV